MKFWNGLILILLLGNQLACQTVRKAFDQGPYWIFIPADAQIGVMAHSLCGSINETFVAFGGIDEDAGKPFSSALYSFDLEASSWSIAPTNGPLPRNFASFAVLDETAYVFGGETADKSETADAWAFHLKSKTWVSLNPPANLEPRKKASLTRVGQKLVLFGGQGVRTWGTYDTYDTSKNSWAVYPLPSSLPSRVSHVAVALDKERVFIWGGFAGDQRLVDGFILNTSTQTFEPLPPPPLSARANARALVLGESVYIWGGASQDEASPVGGAVYHLPSKQWQALPGLPPAFAHLKGSEIIQWSETDFLLIGGRFGTGNFNDEIWIFNTMKFQWNPLPLSPHPDGRIAHCVSRLKSGQLAVFGGIGYERGTQTLSHRGGLWLLRR